MLNFAYFILLLLSIIHLGYPSRFRFTNIVCDDLDPSFSKFEKCSMKAVAPGVSEVSIYVKLLQVPVNQTSLDIQVKLRKRLHLPTPYKFHVDTCAFLRNKRRNPSAELFHEILGFKKYSNMNHTCPFNHDLILHKYRMDKNVENIIPLPNGEYTMFSKWYAYNVVRANVNISFEMH